MDILKEAEKEDVIITAYGKPMAVLHHIIEDDLADYLIEHDPSFWAPAILNGGSLDEGFTLSLGSPQLEPSWPSKNNPSKFGRDQRPAGRAEFVR